MTGGSKGSKLRFVALIGVLALAATGALRAQTRYAVGQNIVPVFEGWERNADGSFNMVYGYMNRNYDEPLDVPVGPEQPSSSPVTPIRVNPRISTTGDSNSSSRCASRRTGARRIWSGRIVSRGKTEKAFGSLWPIWELDTGVYQENRGGAGELGDEDQPPVATLIDSPRPVPQPSWSRSLSPSRSPTTDCRRLARDAPPPRRNVIRTAPSSPRAAAPEASVAPGPRRESPLTQAVVKLDPGMSLGVIWIVYRGDAAHVTFNPAKIAVKDGKATTTVQFSAPGTYVVRGYADDSIFPVPVDVTVEVAGR